METSNTQSKKSNNKVTRFNLTENDDENKTDKNEKKLIEVNTNLQTYEKIEIKKLDNNNENDFKNEYNQLPEIINDNKSIDTTKNNEIVKINKTNEFDHLPSIVKSSHQKKESKSISVSIFNAIKYVDYFPLKAIKVIFCLL
jgi:hypothetical protein